MPEDYSGICNQEHKLDKISQVCGARRWSYLQCQTLRKPCESPLVPL